MKRFFEIILKYIDTLAPGFGLICLIAAGNIFTFVLGLVTTIFYLYRVVKGK